MLAGSATQFDNDKESQHRIDVPPRIDWSTDKEPGYEHLLQELGVRPLLKGPWAMVGRSNRIQGWKLHISCVQTEVLQLLQLVVPFLRLRRTHFKAARSAAILAQLNEGDLGATQVGKFMTIYPESDEDAFAVARELVDLTRGFHGPTIISDLRLGDVTYARYGNFNPVVTRDRLGQVSLSIYSPEGILVVDSYSVPFSLPRGVLNPFADWHFAADQRVATPYQSEGTSPQSKALFGPGYLILQLIKEHAKGAVFGAIDLRSQELVSHKIIKQGRCCCMSDEQGRDIRTRLRHQEKMHNALSDLAFIPRVDPYFEVNGDGYLPVEFIEGESIESLAVRTLNGRAWGNVPTDEQVKLLSCLEQVIQNVKRLHQLGYVHRDLSASNIWVTPAGAVYLLDLELMRALDDSTPAYGLGTPGFMSPQQSSRSPAAIADDIYALGCVATLLLTGLDPRRVLFGCQGNMSQWLALTNEAPAPLLEMIGLATDPNPEVRPDLENIGRSVESVVKSLVLSEADKSAVVPDISTRLTYSLPDNPADKVSIIMRAQRGLLEAVPVAEDSGMWLSPSLSSGNHQMASNSSISFELRRGANRGVAGVVYVLSRLGRLGLGTESARRRVQVAVSWLLNQEEAPDAGMPGLHFGEAGVAVAVTEAIAAGYFTRRASVNSFVERSLSGRLDWPDLTHGAAGQGVAVFACASLLGNQALNTLAHRCADYLFETQLNDGSWRIPDGVPGISGEILTGFAHGVAGIIYFLSEYGHHFPSSRTTRAVEAGAEWLVSQAIEEQTSEGLSWHYSDVNQICWKWWCHGAPGIALAFLKLFERSGKPKYADIARRALLCHPPELRYPNLSVCHGLSGLGEIYIEAARLLGEREWQTRARIIGAVLSSLARQEKDQTTWLVENPHVATADLMGGCAGLIHFLARLTEPGQNLGFPLLL